MGEVVLYSAKTFDEALSPIKEKALSLMEKTEFIRECGFALQAVNASKQLLNADKTSIMQAVYNVALTGLTLNPVLKQAYLVPRYINGKTVAVLEPSYQGLTKLITDTGSVKNIYAYPVYKEDDFEVTMGTRIQILHKPRFASKDILHFYAVAILPDGSTQFEVMTADQVNEIRERSESYKAFKEGKITKCTWVSDYSEMGRKTVIKRLSKYVPKTEQWEKVSNAIDVDNSDYRPTYGQIDFAEGLIATSGYDDDHKQLLMEKINDAGITQSEFDSIVTDLKNNQLDKINSGMNYSQTDISKKIAAEVQ